MDNIIFRTLRADEIEVRPSHTKDGWVFLLLYIKSQAVIALLNETVGNLNWQSKFYEARGQLIGEIGIFDKEKGVWVWKSDTGSESNIEAEKGLISDTYKRVMSRWGVQELYTAPRISVPDNGRGNLGYKVSEILYNEHREITHLVIVNSSGSVVFSWDKDVPQTQAYKPTSITPSVVTTTQATNGSVSHKDGIIQSLRDAANKEYRKEGVNQDELSKFVKFWTKKIEENGWKGATFDFDKLFTSWMSRVYNKAS